MVDTKKFSEFLDGGNLEEGAVSVGISGGQNTRFTTLPQFLPPGTTAERPNPATAGMIRYNTDLNLYEYYNGTIWTQFEDSADIALLIARLAAHTAGDGASMIGLEDQGSVSGKTVQDLAEANYLVISDVSSLANAIAMSSQASGIYVNENGNGTPILRSIVGTLNQLEVTNGDGVGGNIILNIAPNVEISGNESILIPAGTTAQRPSVPVAGMVRYNTELDDLEFYNDSALAWEQTASTGALTAIVQDTTPQLGGNLDANGFDIDMASNSIINLLDPVNAQDASTKNYVDERASFNEIIVNLADSPYTWNKPAEFTADSFIEVWGCAGGGGSGGAPATGTGESSEGGGGGGGGTFYIKIDNASLGSSETVTIGAGGTAGPTGSGSGGTGGTTSFGAHASATGGVGGSSGAPSSGNANGVGGTGGDAIGGDINLHGGDGQTGIVRAGVAEFDTEGGSSYFGQPRTQRSTFNGRNGYLYGSGAVGAISGASTAARPGGAGAEGIVIIREYI